MSIDSDVSAARGKGDTAATTRVYQAVRSGILQGKYRPNERLIEMVIADQQGTSRTPVREAIQRLAADGLIVGGRQGWAVKEFTTFEIQQIFEVRTALEGYATGLAAVRATPEQLRALVELHERERTLPPGHRYEQVELNDEFHRLLIESAGNSRLARACEFNLAYYFNRPVATLMTDAEAKSTIGQHTLIVEALQRRDGIAAEQAAREHISESLRLVLRSPLQEAPGA